MFSTSSKSSADSYATPMAHSRAHGWSQLGRIVLLLVASYVFMVVLQLMAGSVQMAGAGLAGELVQLTTNPFTSLFIGLLATVVVQSSSTTTSLIVSIVAAGGLSASQAIPMIMGANIGTTLTSTIVSLGHIGDRREFRLAVSGASLHDIFNVITVFVLFGLEASTHFLSHAAQSMANSISLGNQPGLEQLRFLTAGSVSWLLDVLRHVPYLAIPIALLALFFSLRLLTFALRGLLIGRIEQNMNRFLFGRPIRGLTSGFLATVALQSSSLTTSLMVPLIATEKVSLRQAFPFVMGANVGTTTTALLAAFIAGSQGSNAALAVAFTHVLFNVIGVLLLYPIPRIRQIPVWLADRLGQLAYQNRLYGVAYVVVIFFILPFLLIFISEGVAWLM